MLGFALRAIGMYFLALLMIRLLGKRALGELGPFDFVVMTGVGHTVVSVALDKSIPFYEGIVILVTLALLEYFMGYVALKNARIGNLITGYPVVLIDDGKIVRENLGKEKFNVDDLLQELRKQGIRDIREVDKGILESCGGFSVILKEEDETVTRRDLGIKGSDENSLLTIENLSRPEFFARGVQEQADENINEEVIQLGDSINKIQEKLEYLCNKIEDIEKQFKTK